MKIAFFVALILLWAGVNWAAFSLSSPEEVPYVYDPECGIPEELDRAFSREFLQIPEEEQCCHLQPFRLLKPETVRWGERYPLLLYLHGAGERGWDNSRHLGMVPSRFLKTSWRQRYPCYVLAPQCPAPLAWPYEAEGPEGEKIDPLGDVMAMVDQVAREHQVDPARIYVMGISMGGYGTWSITCRYPEKFAAAIAVCGGGDPEQAHRLAQLPFWAVHGDQDRVAPVSGSRDMIQGIRAAGGSPHYTELKGVGHGSWPPVVKEDSEMIEWMFEQRKRRSDP